MYTVDLVRAPDFAHSWPEAVAVVQEVVVALGILSTVPAAEDLFLEEDGSVTLGFASETSEDPVAGLAALLRQLLEGTSAPAELGALAGDPTQSQPATPSVAEFSTALAFYERPERRSVVRGVVERLAARRVVEETESAMERLRERIAGSPDVEEDLPAPAFPARAATLRLHHRLAAVVAGWRQRVPNMSRHQVVAGGTIVFAVVTAAAGLSFMPSERPAAAPRDSVGVHTPSPPGGPQPAEASTATSTPAAAVAGVRPTRGAGAAPRVSPTARVAPARELPQKQSRVTARLSTGGAPRPAVAPVAAPGRITMLPIPPTVRMSPDEVPTATKGTTVPRSTAETSARPPGRAPTGGDGLDFIYSASEPGVRPAQLLRSQLPKQPVAGVDTGYFDLIVDEAGDVQFVRLTSPRNRYQDRMLVAAAKAWKFKPALLEGKPVKYRLRMPVIVPEPD